jgi:hypothetical protein
MSPRFIPPEPPTLARHTQRPWRAVEPRTPSARPAARRTYAAAVVRELPRPAQREPVDTW